MNAQPIETRRHSYAHLLAAAIEKLFPGTKFGVGPVTENGFYYDVLSPTPLRDEDLAKLTSTMKKLIKEKPAFERSEMPLDDAIALFKDKGQDFKIELLGDLKKHGTTAMKQEEREAMGEAPKTVSLYTTGEFTDLCRGPHVETAKDLNPDSFKLTSIAGAYWRGSEKNPQLQRIYGVAFSTKEELEKYLWQLEEAKKRDHRVLGAKLKLFTFASEVGPGLPLWLPNGTAIREALETYAKEVERGWGYKRVVTPHLGKEDLYKMSGHIPYYAEDMYPAMKLDDGNYYLKGMNCPHTHMIYKSEPRSYRDLPLRYAEYGAVYRHELSGTLSGLLRVRGFSQNDAHIYVREDQVEEEFLNVMELHKFWYDLFGIKDYSIRLSLPAKDKKKYAGEEKEWEKAVEKVRSVMKKSGIPYREAEDEAAFYGPKADFQIKSVIGTEYTASTNQLDFLASKRFNLNYIDSDGKEKPIYVIHRAPLGSHERFIAFLIEHYAGAFPVWLAPVQVVVATISEKHEDYGKKVYDVLFNAGIRVELRNDGETIGKKIRETETQKVPYMLIVGDKEVEAENVAVRKRGEGDKGQIPLDEFIAQILEEIKSHK